jgi:hypothetical protein
MVGIKSTWLDASGSVDAEEVVDQHNRAADPVESHHLPSVSIQTYYQLWMHGKI